MNPMVDQYKEMVRRNKARDARAEMARQLTERERAVLVEKITKAMYAGDVEPWALSRFDHDPIGVLDTFPAHIKERYGFPTFEVLSKSLADPGGFLGTGVHREDISARVRSAVEEGALPLNALSQFDADPLKVL